MATNPAVTDQENPEEDEVYAQEDHPEEIEDESDPPTYGENNRDLPQNLKDAIGSLIKSFQQRDMYDRRIEVLMDRILRFYDDGVQHIYPNFGTGVYQIGVAGGYVDLGGGRQIECPEYMGAYNIFRARRRSIDAVLTQNPPGIDFVPDKPGTPEDEQSAEIAEGYRELFDQANDLKRIQQDMSRMMELSGRVVAWTYTAKDKQRWGLNAEGEPRQMETSKIYGTLESKVPIACKDFAKCLYVFLYDDLDILLAKASNTWIRSKISAGQAGLGESDWERYARLGVKQARKSYYLTGTALAHLTTEMNCFIRPGSFEDKCCDEPFVPEPEDETPELEPDEETGFVSIRSKLQQLYPDGLHVKYIGENYSESWNEAMDDAITIGFPDQRDGMTGGALMEPMKLIQDVFNDYKNAERENYEKGWPATYISSSQNDYDAIVDTRSSPGRYHLMKDAPNGDVKASIFKEPGFDVPNSFVAAQDELRGTLSQDITGALPALQGASGNDQTASGQAMDRAQAMGMLGPTWANMQRMFSCMYYQAAMLASKNPDHGKEVTIAKQDGSKVTLQLSKIRKGTFKAIADVDSSFPESTAAKRANLQALLAQIIPTPLGAAFLDSPDNWSTILELNGNPDVVLTPDLAFRKQTREFEILLGEPPTSNQAAVDQYNIQHASDTIQAMDAGLPEPPYNPPPPLLPSLMPEMEDYHDWEMKKCDEYLSGEDCWLRQNIGDPNEVETAKAGIQNLRLHRMMHFMMKNQIAGAMPPPYIPPAPAPPPQPGANQQIPEANAAVNKKAAAPGSTVAPTL